MVPSSPSAKNTEPPEDLPFLAPCKKLDTWAPIGWVKLGWQDLRNAPVLSLGYGLLLVVCSYIMTVAALRFGNLAFLFALGSGFIFLGPLLAMAFYEISLQLQRGVKPTLESTFKASLSHIGDQMMFALMLLVIFLVWVRSASMIHVFFPTTGNPNWVDLTTFLAIGTLVGSLFSALVFC